MAAVRAVQAGEAGVEVAALEERVDGGGGFAGEAGQLCRVIVEHLRDGRGAGLAGAVADADHLGNGSRWACRRRGQGRAIPKLWGKQSPRPFLAIGGLPFDASPLPVPCGRASASLGSRKFEVVRASSVISRRIRK
jgi:hypothetical protein